MISKIFSYWLLIVYAAVIFQDEVIQGVHIMSHATEILSNQFSFHQHGNGNFHVHHSHGLLDTFQTILQHEKENQNTQKDQQVPEFDFQVKFHLPELSLMLSHPFDIHSIDFFTTTNMLCTQLSDVLTPPPKFFI